MDQTTILQWNIRGFRANIAELKIVLHDKNSSVVCLQEIKMKDSDDCSLKGYDGYSKCNTAINDSPTGGVAVLVKRGVPHKEITLRTTLQAVAVTVSLHIPITVCSIYLPPGFNHTIVSELDNLVPQLPPPFLLLGDFNSHSDLWGQQQLRPDGKMIEEFMSHNDLNFLNDGSHTYLHPGNSGWSAIDLSLCTPSIYLDFNWTVDDDQHGSDHFPIHLSHKLTHETSSPRWVLKRADWELFGSSLYLKTLFESSLSNLIRGRIIPWPLSKAEQNCIW